MGGKRDGRDRRRVLSTVGDALLLVIGCLAWIIAAVMIALLFWR
jgi:hypothetical protein